MSILDTLARDHRTLEQLVTDLTQVPTTEPSQRVAVFGQLQALLQGHSRAEEEVVYRRLRRAVPDEPKILEAYEEHHVADVLLQELASACPGGRGWTAKLRVLEELLRLHIKEEETFLFPLVTERMPTEALTRMDDEFALLKHEGLEAALGPLRRAAPAFAGRAMIFAQAAAGRFVRRSELYVRRALGRIER